MKKIIVGILIAMLLFATTSVAGTTNNINTDDTNSNVSSDPDWWPMFQHDPEHTGFSTSPLGPLIPTWSYTTNAYVTSSPSVVENKVYIGSRDDKIYCLNAIDGTGIWNYTTNGDVASSPAVAIGKIYVGSLDNSIYCLDAEGNGDGTTNKLWSYPAGDDVYSSPTIVDGKVYFGSKDKKVYCLNAENGNFIWSFSTLGYVLFSPAVANGKVYVGSYDNKIYCLNASDGSFIWSYTTGGDVTSSPAVVNGKVFIGSHDGNVYCFNAENGSFIWNFSTGSQTWSSPAIDYGKVYIGAVDSKIYCLDAEGNGNGTTHQLWNYSTGGNVYSSPAIADGKVYIGSYDNKVYCLNAEDGSFIWSYTTGGNVWSSPAIADSKLYIGSYDSRVYCFRANEAPETPDKPDGPNEGVPGEELCFSTNSTDPDGDDIFYWFNWGDGSNTGWLGPYELGEAVNACNTWTEGGTYEVKVKAKDNYDATSDWSEPVEVTIYQPKLEIGEITGGLLQVSVEIKNNGSANATNVNWSVSVNGGILGLINVSNEGTFATIEANATEVVSVSPIFGLGNIRIEVTVSAEGDEEVTKTVNGFVLFFYILLS